VTHEGTLAAHPLAISRRKLLLLEGKDEEHFFNELLACMDILDVQCLEVGGKDRFPESLRLLTSGTVTGFDRVERYAIIRDSHDSPEDTLKSVCDLLRKTGQPVPPRPGVFTTDTVPRVAVYLLPSPQRRGSLEDLCLESFKDHPVMPCVDNFIECLRRSSQKSRGGVNPATAFFPNNVSKARVQALLAAAPSDVRSIGVAAQKGIWNFEHEAFADLKSFLENFR